VLRAEIRGAEGGAAARRPLIVGLIPRTMETVEAVWGATEKASNFEPVHIKTQGSCKGRKGVKSGDDSGKGPKGPLHRHHL
jgi:hypothetical protein